MKKIKFLAFALVAFIAGTVKVSALDPQPIAKIGEDEFATLQEAVDSITAYSETATTIEILRSTEEGETTPGIMLTEAAPKNIVIDFKDFTLQLGEPLVGSVGTLTQNFHLERGSKVELKNGTLKSSASSKMLLQVYCDLTLRDMTIDSTTSELTTYAMSNNYGTINILGSTSILSEAVAFDVYFWPTHKDGAYKEGPQVTVDTTGEITGKIEVTRDSGNQNPVATLKIKNINHDGDLFVATGLESEVEISGGTFSDEAAADYLKEGYVIDAAGRVGLPVQEVDIDELDLNQEVTEITIGVADVEALEEILLDALEANTEIDTTGINASINIDIEEINEDDLGEGLVESIREELEKNHKGAEILGYFDINLNVINKDTGGQLGNLTELGEEITLSVLLPNELKTARKGYKRVYYFVRIHNGEIEVLDAELSEDGNVVSTETDKFSVYTLVSREVQDVTNPTTFDGISSYLIIGFISLVGLTLIISYAKRKKLFS